MAAPPTEQPDTVGERRHVALMFCDLCDYTRLSEDIDPEETAALRKQIVSHATRVILAHRGAITQCYGDGILAVFGVQESSEDDIRWSIDAALELRNLTRELPAEIVMPGDFELRMHFGLHSGLVFVQSGDDLYGRYELTGDPVNTTARLCAAAERDEILVSASALQGIEPFYETEAVRALMLKGKRAPFLAFRIRARSNINTRFEAHSRRGLTHFVGRRAELEQLERMRRELQPGWVKVASIVGSAGIGKTRLLEEFIGRCGESEAEVYRGACENYRKLAPLQPFVQMLQQLFGIRSAMTHEQASVLVATFLVKRGERLSAHTDAFLQLLSLSSRVQPAAPPSSQQALLTALRELFASLSSPRPLLLIIDDWQWADDLSHEVLRMVMRSIAGRGLLVLLATRQHDEGDLVLARAHSIELRPFQDRESSEVIHALRPDMLDQRLGTAIHRRSGGNPLFLEELCRALPNEASTFAYALRHPDVPGTISAVIHARLEHIAPQALQVLRVAAVIGHGFSAQLLGLASDFPELSGALDHLTQCDLLRKTEADGSAYRFKHGITREVVYESVRLSERRRIHGVIARLLEERSAASETGDEYEALAYHHAGSGNHERAAHYANLSGDKAMAASSLDNARVQYALALAELGKLPADLARKRTWLELSAKFGRALVYNPVVAELELLERSAQYARDLDDLSALGDIQQLLAFTRYALGDYRAALRHCRDGIETATRAGEAKLVGQLTSNLGQILAASGQYGEALTHLNAALDQKRGRVSGRSDRPLPIGFAYTLGCKALVHAHRGDFDLSSSVLDEANQLMLSTGHAVEGSVLGLQGMTQIWQGEWTQCIASVSRAAETAERVNFSYVFAMSQTMSGYARFMLDGSPEAVVEVQRAVDWLERHERLLFVSFCYGCLAEILILSGDAERALDYARRALQRAERDADPLGEAAAHRVLARHARGNLTEMQAALQRAFDAGAARDSRREHVLTCLLDAQLRHEAGERASLRDGLRDVVLAFERMGMSWHREQAVALLA